MFAKNTNSNSHSICQLKFSDLNKFHNNQNATKLKNIKTQQFVKQCEKQLQIWAKDGSKKEKSIGVYHQHKGKHLKSIKAKTAPDSLELMRNKILGLSVIERQAKDFLVRSVSRNSFPTLSIEKLEKILFLAIQPSKKLSFTLNLDGYKHQLSQEIQNHYRKSLEQYLKESIFVPDESDISCSNPLQKIIPIEKYSNLTIGYNYSVRNMKRKLQRNFNQIHKNNSCKLSILKDLLSNTQMFDFPFLVQVFSKNNGSIDSFEFKSLLASEFSRFNNKICQSLTIFKNANNLHETSSNEKCSKIQRLMIQNYFFDCLQRYVDFLMKKSSSSDSKNATYRPIFSYVISLREKLDLKLIIGKKIDPIQPSTQKNLENIFQSIFSLFCDQGIVIDRNAIKLSRERIVEFYQKINQMIICESEAIDSKLLELSKRLQLNELHKIEDKIANSNDLMCLEDLFETVKEIETNLDQVGLTIKVTDQSCFAIEPLKFQIISLCDKATVLIGEKVNSLLKIDMQSIISSKNTICNKLNSKIESLEEFKTVLNYIKISYDEDLGNIRASIEKFFRYSSDFLCRFDSVSTSEFNFKDCFECLNDVNETLKRCEDALVIFKEKLAIDLENSRENLKIEATELSCKIKSFDNLMVSKLENIEASVPSCISEMKTLLNALNNLNAANDTIKETEEILGETPSDFQILTKIKELLIIYSNAFNICSVWFKFNKRLLNSPFVDLEPLPDVQTTMQNSKNKVKVLLEYSQRADFDLVCHQFDSEESALDVSISSKNSDIKSSDTPQKSTKNRRGSLIKTQSVTKKENPSIINIIRAIESSIKDSEQIQEDYNIFFRGNYSQNDLDQISRIIFQTDSSDESNLSSLETKLKKLTINDLIGMSLQEKFDELKKI